MRPWRPSVRRRPSQINRTTHCGHAVARGVQLATIQKLARYWATEYDWRTCEAKLNALPQFISEIDGLDIHFIHVRSRHEDLVLKPVAPVGN